MMKLDRSGIFKARPVAMGVQTAKESRSVAVWIEFLITDQLDGTEWQSWAVYEEHSITGYFWVVKRDGTINNPTVENLALVLDWDGNLESIGGDPPDIPVQITVQEDTYKDRTSLKVAWLNAADSQPKAVTASPEQVKQINSQFGSLLRAAAGAARKTKTKPAGKPAPRTAASKPETATQTATIDDGGMFDPENPNQE